MLFSTRTSPNVSLRSVDNGERFVFGMMPGSVTFLQLMANWGVKNNGGDAVSKAGGLLVLPPGKVKGTAFGLHPGGETDILPGTCHRQFFHLEVRRYYWWSSN